MGKESLLIVLSTAPSRETAEVIASAVLEKHLAACVNIVPGAVSRYWWKGALEQATEVLLLIKTARGNFTELERVIKSVHPYENPEVVALKAKDVSQAYLEWALSECSTKEAAPKEV